MVTIGEAFIKISPEMTGFSGLLSKGIGGALGELGGTLGGLAKVGVGAFAAVGVAAAGLGAEAVHMAADFQAQMTQLVTGAGESRSNLAAVGAGIQKMAGEVGTSASDLAKGMYLIESAGFHGAGGLDILKSAAEGAKVGNSDMATVANAVTSALNSYGLGAGSAASITNDLVATVSVGKTHMEDLAGAMGTVLPIAAALKVPMDQVTAAIATMTEQGTGAAQAATYLRFTMGSLAAPTKIARDTLASLGLSSTQVADTLTTQGLPAALQLLTDSIGKKFPAGSAEYIAALKNVVGGTRGMQGVLELIGPHMEVFQSNLQKISAAANDGSGAIRGWADVQQNFNQILDQTKGTLGSAMITIGTQLLPLVAQILPVLAGFAGALVQAAGPIFSALLPALSALAAALTPILTMIGTTLAQAIVRLTPVFLSFIIALVPLVPPIIMLLDIGINLIAKFLGPLLAAITPLLPVIEHLAVVVASDLMTALEQLFAAFVPLLPIISSVGVQLITALAPAFDALAMQAPVLVSLLIPMAQAFVALLPALVPLVSALSQMVVFLAPLTPLILGVVAGFKAWAIIQAIISGIVPVMAALNAVMALNPFILITIAIIGAAILIYKNWDTIKAAFQEAWHFIEGVMGSIGDAFSSGWEFVKGIFNGLVGWFGSHWQLILAAMAGPLGLLVLYVKDHFTQVVDFLKELPGKVLSFGVQIMEGLLNGIINGFVQVATWMIQLPFFLLAFFITMDVLLVEKGIALLTGFTNGIINAAPQVWAFFIGLPGQIQGFLVTIGTWLISHGVSLIVGFYNAIVSQASTVWGFFSGLPGRILGLLTSLGGLLISRGSDTISGFLEGIQSLAGNIWNFFSGIPGRILDLLKDAPNLLVHAGEQIIQGLINGVGHLAGGVAKAIGDAVQGGISAALHVGGVFSPSKVFHEIGLNLMQGLTNGIVAGTGGPVSAMAGALRALPGGGQGGLGLTPFTGAGAARSPAPGVNGPAVVIQKAEFRDEADVDVLMRKVEMAVLVQGGASR